jgi:carbamoyl-phosphate synthase small subunit
MMTPTARLALEDGSVWRGAAFGASGTRPGEVVFNTSLTGYQEILTDPSYAGQIVVMTAPQIGNTGINLDDDEARRVFLSGLLVRELSPCVSNWRASMSLSDWLSAQGVIGVTGMDTRALTRRLRDRGTLRGVLTTEPDCTDAELVAQARAWPGLDGIDMARTVTCQTAYTWSAPTDAVWEFRHWQGQSDVGDPPKGLHVVAYDFGVKRNILRRLGAHGCGVTVVPATTSAAEVLALQPDGVLLSNGPGDPAARRGVGRHNLIALLLLHGAFFSTPPPPGWGPHATA